MKHSKEPWKIVGGEIKSGNRAIATLWAKKKAGEAIANAKLIAAGPELLAACKEAQELIRVARRYFPKSIKNSDKFTLENTCASIGKAVDKATN